MKNDKEMKLYWDKKTEKSRHRIMVTLGSIIFRRVLDGIMDLVLNLVLIDSKVRRGFIRGLFAGEGTVSLSGNSLHRVIITQGYRDPTQDKMLGKPKREFIKKLLKYEGIKTQNNKSGMNVVVTNLKNLEIFNNLKLYKLHKEKAKKFESGFMKLKKSKRSGISNMEAQLEVLDLLLKKGPISVLEISKLRGTGVHTTREIFNGRKDRNRKGLLYSNYAFISYRIKLGPSKRLTRLFDITEKGRVYLEDLKSKLYS